MRELEKIKIEYNNLNSEVKNIVNIHINKIRNYLINIDFDSSVFYRKIGRAMSDIYYLSSKELLISRYLREIRLEEDDEDLLLKKEHILIDLDIILKKKKVDYMYQ